MSLIPKVIPGKRCKRHAKWEVRGLPFDSVLATHGHVGDPKKWGLDQYFLCDGDLEDVAVVKA